MAAATATPPVVAVKGRRCATPTGVEGIMHIEMDTIRGDEAGLQQRQQQQQLPSEHKPLRGGVGASAAAAAAAASVGSKGLALAGAVQVKQEQQQQQQRRHRRPTPIITAPAGAANNHGAAGQPQHQHHTRARSGRRGSSFAYTDDDIAFSRATKQKRAAAAATAAAMAAVTSASSAAASSPRATMVDAGGDMGGAVAAGAGAGAGAALMSCNIRKRSAEALGHCESGSGFGAPAARRRLVAGKVARRVSLSAAGGAASAMPATAPCACVMPPIGDATGRN
ncbi:unnamed protein product [Ectocarpus fasciculatus]